MAATEALPQWQKDFTTQDARWMLRKAEAQTGAAFKAWLSTLYDPRDPAQAEMLNKGNLHSFLFLLLTLTSSIIFSLP